nr:hypothetical protein DWF04_06245 [Cereibacter sphaeroides f. sp. denitrificans]
MAIDRQEAETMRYRNKLTGQEVVLTAAEDARFFDNRSPFEWERVEAPAPRTLREFVTDEVDA